MSFVLSQNLEHLPRYELAGPFAHDPDIARQVEERIAAHQLEIPADHRLSAAAILPYMGRIVRGMLSTAQQDHGLDISIRAPFPGQLNLISIKGMALLNRQFKMEKDTVALTQYDGSMILRAGSLARNLADLGHELGHVFAHQTLVPTLEEQAGRQVVVDEDSDRHGLADELLSDNPRWLSAMEFITEASFVEQLRTRWQKDSLLQPHAHPASQYGGYRHLMTFYDALFLECFDSDPQRLDAFKQLQRGHLTGQPNAFGPLTTAVGEQRHTWLTYMPDSEVAADHAAQRLGITLTYNRIKNNPDHHQLSMLGPLP